MFGGFFDDDEDDETPAKPAAAAAAVADAVVAPTAAPVVPIVDVNPTKIAAIISPVAQADAVNTVPLDLAHTPALLQLAQTAANEVDATNLEPVNGLKAGVAPAAAENVVVDVIAESTQQVVNQLSESVANAKQNDIQGNADGSAVERGASATAKPKPEEDILDIVESIIDTATEDDDDEREEEEEEKKPEVTPSPPMPVNDKDEINDDVNDDDDDEDLRRK